MSETKGLEVLGEDRPFLDFIIELLKEFLPVLLKCFVTAEAVAKELQDPGIVTRARLRLGIGQKLRDNETIAVLARPLFHSTLAVMKTTTKAEVKEMAGSF